MPELKRPSRKQIRSCRMQKRPLQTPARIAMAIMLMATGIIPIIAEVSANLSITLKGINTNTDTGDTINTNSDTGATTNTHTRTTVITNMATNPVRDTSLKAANENMALSATMADTVAADPLTTRGRPRLEEGTDAIRTHFKNASKCPGLCSPAN